MTDMIFHPGEPVDQELQRLLGRYADVRLAPDLDAMRRVRGAVVAAARTAAARTDATTIAAADHTRTASAAIVYIPIAARATSRPRTTSWVPPVIGHPRPMQHAAVVDASDRDPTSGLFARWSPRRLGVTLSFAILAGAMLGGTALAGSQAGGPLYAARLWVEAVALPQDPAARLEAEIARAQARLAEASAASARSDGAAATAALDAYSAIVEETLSGVGDVTGRDQAALAFQHHRSVLQGLLTQLPEQAQVAVAHALAESDLAIARFADDASGGSTGGGANSGGSTGGGSTGGGSTSGGGSTGGGGSTDGADPSDGGGSTGGSTGGDPSPRGDPSPLGPDPARTPKPAPDRPATTPNPGGPPGQPTGGPPDDED